MPGLLRRFAFENDLISGFVFYVNFNFFDVHVHIFCALLLYLLNMYSKRQRFLIIFKKHMQIFIYNILFK